MEYARHGKNNPVLKDRNITDIVKFGDGNIMI